MLRHAVLADHVHVVVSFRPDTRLSDFIRLAKAVAATRANRQLVPFQLFGTNRRTGMVVTKSAIRRRGSRREKLERH